MSRTNPVSFSDPITSTEAEARLLYHAILCPFSRQIRLGLLEKKIGFRLREEKIWRPSETLYTLNPEGSIPVLQDQTLTLITPYAIMEYLEETYPQLSLLGSQTGDRAEVRRLVTWFNQKFNEEVTTALLYEKTLKRNLGHGGPNSQILKQGRTLIHDHLEYIGWLFDRRKWLAGDFFSWADIAAASHLSCLDYLGDVPWDKHPGAKDWYVRIKSRPHFRPFLQEISRDAPSSAHYRLLDF